MTTPHVLLLTGPDTPGVLSGLFDALAQLRCQLGDMQVSRLAGRCSGVVVFDAPDGVDRTTVLAGLEPLSARGITIQVDPLEGERALRHRPNSRPFVVSYNGADRPRMLELLTHALDDFGCDFVSMSTDVVVGDNADAHVFVCEVDAPPDTDTDSLQAVCNAVGQQCNVSFLVMPANLDEVAN